MSPTAEEGGYLSATGAYDEAYYETTRGAKTGNETIFWQLCNRSDWVSEVRKDFTYSFLFFFGVPASFIIIVTVVGNLLVLCFKARVGRRSTTLLVWNLGLADFLVGLFVLPCAASVLIFRKWLFGRTLCRIWVFCDIVFCTSSIITICVISGDRYMAVTRPLRYKTLVTKSKVILAMLLIWLMATFILLGTVRWDLPDCFDPYVCFAGNEIRYLAHSVAFAFFLPAFVTLTLYYRIYTMARNRQRALDRGFLMVFGQNMNFLTNTVSNQTQAPLRVHYGRGHPDAGNKTDPGMVEHQRRVLRTHERIAKTLGVVSCAFLFCWLPFFSLYLTNSQCDCIPPLVLDVATWLGYCNSMINPIIYAFTVKEFKKSAMRIFLPCWRVAHRCAPCLCPAPGGVVVSHRMSRGQRPAGAATTKKARGKCGGPPPPGAAAGLASAAVAAAAAARRNRRQTEPAVFGGGITDVTSGGGPVMIGNEDDEEVSSVENGRLVGATATTATYRRTTPSKGAAAVVDYHSTAQTTPNPNNNKTTTTTPAVGGSNYSVKLYCVTSETEI